MQAAKEIKSNLKKQQVKKFPFRGGGAKLFILGLVLISIVSSYAQEPPFYNDIQAFKQEEKKTPPSQNAIVFVGSSSFRKWTDVQSYFPGYTIINRGFGGSTLPDVIRYVKDIITPYHPKQVVIYCGDNDLAASDTVTAATVTDRFKQLFSLIRSGLPDTKITYVSIKPSPSRENLMPEMAEANREIQGFLKTKPNTSFVDVYHLMLNANGKPMGSIFLDDSLHMNEKGYAIWQKAIQPHLVK